MLKKNNNSGYTLVEVLVAITILSIILVALIPVFPQVISWSNKNESNLVADNVVEKFIYEFENNSDSVIKQLPTKLPNCETPTTYTGAYANQEVQGYTSELDVCQNDDENNYGLYRFNIKIYEIGESSHLIDTYFYLHDKRGDAS